MKRFGVPDLGAMAVCIVIMSSRWAWRILAVRRSTVPPGVPRSIISLSKASAEAAEAGFERAKCSTAATLVFDLSERSSAGWKAAFCLRKSLVLL